MMPGKYFERGLQIVVRTRRDLDASESASLASLDRKEKAETTEWFKSVHRGDCYKFRHLTLTGGGRLTPCDCVENSNLETVARQERGQESQEQAVHSGESWYRPGT
jgi:hypothetical protein